MCTKKKNGNISKVLFKRNVSNFKRKKGIMDFEKIAIMRLRDGAEISKRYYKNRLCFVTQVAKIATLF